MHCYRCSCCCELTAPASRYRCSCCCELTVVHSGSHATHALAPDIALQMLLRAVSAVCSRDALYMSSRTAASYVLPRCVADC
eukprot:16352159-Heterocapsa_arctica.AAC.1